MLSMKDAQDYTRKQNRTGKMYYAQLLDIQPEEYEAQIAPFIRRRMRKLDIKPLTRTGGKDDLYDKKGEDSV